MPSRSAGRGCLPPHARARRGPPCKRSACRRRLAAWVQRSVRCSPTPTPSHADAQRVSSQPRPCSGLRPAARLLEDPARDGGPVLDTTCERRSSSERERGALEPPARRLAGHRVNPPQERYGIRSAVSRIPTTQTLGCTHILNNPRPNPFCLNFVMFITLSYFWRKRFSIGS